MTRRPALLRLLGLSAAALRAAGISVGHGEDGRLHIPPAVARPPRAFDERPGSHRQRPPDAAPARPAEDCEAGELSWGGFLGGLMGGASVTMLGTLLGVQRASLAEAKDAKAPQERPAEAPSGSEESTASQDKTTRKRPSGCTDEVESMHLFWPRAGFLVVMLLLQSVSSVILSGFEGLIQNQSALIFFLTMIVGLGGNAGGQSLVLAVRRLATGRHVSIGGQLLVGFQLCAVVVPVAFLRAELSRGTSFGISATVATTCFLVLLSSMAAGSSIPRLFLALGVDPAHGAAFVQVLMDISGIAIVCVVAAGLLGG